MAITASIALGSATVTTLTQVSALLTVSNSGGSAVLVSAVVPTCVVNGSTQVPGAINMGLPNMGPGQNVTVPAGGNVVLNWSLVPMAPNVGVYNANPYPSAGVGGVAIVPLQPESQPAQQVYSIGALVYTTDGAVTTATPAVLTVNSLKVT